jgi:hypothetical protein
MTAATTMRHEPDHTRTVHLPAGSVVEFRPDPLTAWRSSRSRVAVLMALVAMVGVAAGPTALLAGATIALAACAASAAAVASTSVTVTCRTLTRRRLGRTTTVRLDGRQRGLLCMIRRERLLAGSGAGGGSTRRVAHLSVADAIGRRISLSGTAFTPAALAEVAELTGATALACHEPLTPGQARAAAPGVVSGLVPWAGLTVMLVAGAVAVAGVLALGS